MKFLCSAENKRVDLENFRHNYQLGVGQEHRMYRNLSNTENIVLYSRLYGRNVVCMAGM